MMVTTIKPRRKAAVVMTDDEIASVRALVDAHGVNPAATMLGLSRNTVLSILGRVPVHRANAELVRMKLAGLAAAG